MGSKNHLKSMVSMFNRKFGALDLSGRKLHNVHGFEKRFYCKEVEKSVDSSSSSSSWVLGWLRRHKCLALSFVFTVSFGCLEWVPISNRIHLAMSHEGKIDKARCCLAWEVKGLKYKEQILSPESPESVRVANVLRQILQAMDQGLKLSNDSRVSVYEPRKELQGCRSSYAGLFELVRKVMAYYSSRPNRNVSYKSQKVRKFGIKYGTEHLEGLNWEVMVVDNDTLYAANISNGRIVISTGWLQIPGIEDPELAVILAHEVGHEIARHLSEHLLTELWLFTLAFLPLVKFLGFITIPIISVAVIEIKYFINRRRELEADRIGMMLMAAAGYDPCTAPLFYKYFEIDPPFFKARHPTGAKRAKKLEKVRVMKKAKNIYKQARAGNRIEPFI